MLTAVVGIPLLVYVSSVRSLIPAVAFSFVLSILCAVEIVRAIRSKRTRAPFSLHVWTRLPYFVLFLAIVLNASVEQLLLYGSIAGIIGLIVASYYRYIDTAYPPYTLWISLPTACIIAVKAYDTRSMSGLWEFHFGTPLLLLFLCLWAGDTAAFFVGKSLGKYKLAPTISPNKTIEGAVANLIAASAVGLFLAEWCGLTQALGLAVGTIIGLAGQMGDLYESAWKRSLGIKDSGNLLPGHGGLLDRFDSLLFAAPPVAALLYSGWLK